MPSKAVRTLMGCLIAVLLLAIGFSGGVAVGWAFPLRSRTPVALQASPQTAAPEQTAPAPTTKPLLPSLPQLFTAKPGSRNTAETDALFEPFWQAWQIVHDQYVDQPVNDKELMQGAIRGMMDGLGDKHSSYMDPEQYRQQQTPLAGEYDGIGAWVDTTLDFVTIMNPMPGSPAEKAGLKAGDEIVAVDGEDMTGIDGSLVLRRILGPAGSKVKLTIRRADTKDFDVTLARERILVPSIVSKMMDNNIAYVQITTFGDKTTADLRKALKGLMNQKPKGMVLDLRNNGGGYLNTAIEVVSEFVDSGVVMYEQYGDGTKRSFEALGNGQATRVPLVVLVNEATASASEITAGAIQDFGRGKLVGVKTYGKGSVQNWVPLDGDNGAVRVTVARWLTPKERQINGVGLTPDVVIELTEDDIKNKKDPQLDKAVQMLSAK